MIAAIVGMVILLGGLIFFHELGHYTVAKIFGIHVEVFSLGFGKKLITKRIGETDYCLSLIPFGGYVKLMGDDPSQSIPAADAARAFSTQKLYKRFLIVGAGPFANLLMAFLLFIVIFWVGKPVDSTRIGSVALESPAWNAGIRPQDLITQVDNDKVIFWKQIEEKIRDRNGQKVSLTVQREGKTLTISIPTSLIRTKSPYGEEALARGIKGISPFPVANVIGVSPLSIAYQAGLRTKDRIHRVGDRAVARFDEIEAALLASKGRIGISVMRQTEPKKQATELSFILERATSKSMGGSWPQAARFGIFPSELFVKRVLPSGPAERAGIQEEDRIVAVNGRKVYDFETLIDSIQDAGEASRTATITLERQSGPVNINLSPEPKQYRNPHTGEPFTRYLLGIEPLAAHTDSEKTLITIRNPLELLATAATETYQVSQRMVVSIGKLMTGQISAKNLGGPILIASIAGKSLNAGVIQFFQTMALISLNLFLLNLFPIPILDGGHLLFFTMEAIKGKPVSIRTMEIANQIGMVFILLLIALTLFNDISGIVMR